jgi:hypothetical protein
MEEKQKVKTSKHTQMYTNSAMQEENQISFLAWHLPFSYTQVTSYNPIFWQTIKGTVFINVKVSNNLDAQIFP